MSTVRFEQPITTLSAQGSITVYEPGERDLLVAIEVKTAEGDVAWCRLSAWSLGQLMATLNGARAIVDANAKRDTQGGDHT